MGMNLSQQAISGVIAPELAEGLIRETYASVASHAAAASLGKMLTRTIILAPLAWLVMAGPYFGKLAPFLMRRYTLTNRRLMIRAGWKGSPIKEVPLEQIDEVRLVRDANSDFFRAANLEIISDGRYVLTLHGVPDPEGFRHAILDSRNAGAGQEQELGVFAGVRGEIILVIPSRHAI